MKNRPHLQIISERGNHVPVYPALQLQTPSTLFGVVSWGLRGNLRSTPGFLDHFGMENPWFFPIFPARFPKKTTWFSPASAQHSGARPSSPGCSL